jgi:AcrR family transcriptional regulator
MADHYNRRVDWVKIEKLYRAGMLSLREIARECGTSGPNILYHAKKNGWTRDLTQEVRKRTRSKLVENLAQVYDATDTVKQIKLASDDEIIEQAARTQVQVVREHQRTLGTGHGLVMRMLNELDATTTHRGEMEDMIKSDIAPRRQGALMNAVSLGNRATVLRDLAIAAKTWVTLERQAFNIADDRGEATKEQIEMSKKTADELKQEIIKDANRLGLDLVEALGVGNKEESKIH